MKPEPTPVSGTLPKGSVVVPLVVILTTAGLSLVATSMTADDSLTVTCWVPPMVVAGPTFDDGAGLSNAPARSSTSTVPVEATTADRREAAMTVPMPGPARWLCDAGAGAAAAGSAVADPQAGADAQAGWGPHAGADARAGSPGAGSYQRSSAGWPEGEAHAQRASGRGSGVGA
jgi:hypothetical protein